MDEHVLPSEDPDLADVWPEMTPDERLRYQLAENEQPPEVAEQTRQMFRER